jgi:hypothetical protein
MALVRGRAGPGGRRGQGLRQRSLPFSSPRGVSFANPNAVERSPGDVGVRASPHGPIRDKSRLPLRCYPHRKRRVCPIAPTENATPITTLPPLPLSIPSVVVRPGSGLRRALSMFGTGSMRSCTLFVRACSTKTARAVGRNSDSVLRRMRRRSPALPSNRSQTGIRGAIQRIDTGFDKSPECREWLILGPSHIAMLHRVHMDLARLRLIAKRPQRAL